MNPRSTAILALVVAALGAFLWFYEIGGEEERSRAEQAKNRVFAGIEAEDVEWLELLTPDGERARLERSDEGWMLAEPVRFWADSFATDGLVQAVAELESEVVFDEPEALAEYGLDGEPDVRFGAGGEEHALRIGDKTPVGANTYTKGDAGPRVWAVTTHRLNAIRKSVKDLRDPRVIVFDREAVTGLLVRWPGSELEVAKGDDGWRVTAPVEGPADTDTVEGLLSTLQFLRAEDFEDEPPDDSQAGLDSPSFEVELRSAEGADPVRLAIGSASSDAQRLARGRAEDALYRIGEARLDDMPRRVSAYRFKQLARFAAGDASRFEIAFAAEQGGEPLTVTGERVESGWNTAPEPMAAGKASRLVSELSSLEAEDIAADAMGEAELAAVGLRPPRVSLRVLGDAGDEGGEAPLLADVRLGAADSDRGIAAQRAGDDVVYWLDFELGEHLPLGRDAFLNRFVSEEESEEESGEGVVQETEPEEAGDEPASSDEVPEAAAPLDP